MVTVELPLLKLICAELDSPPKTTIRATRRSEKEIREKEIREKEIPEQDFETGLSRLCQENIKHLS